MNDHRRVLGNLLRKVHNLRENEHANIRQLGRTILRVALQI
jgi:hypothetical protein